MFQTNSKATTSCDNREHKWGREATKGNEMNIGARAIIFYATFSCNSSQEPPLYESLRHVV